MIRNHKKYAITVVGVLFFFILFFMKTERESRLCMGISFITDEEIGQMAVQYQDIDNIVSMQGYLLPYNKETRDVYIPCALKEGMKYNEKKRTASKYFTRV